MDMERIYMEGEKKEYHSGQSTKHRLTVQAQLLYHSNSIGNVDAIAI